MRTFSRPVTRLGMALTAALLGLATVTATAAAEPTAQPPSGTTTPPAADTPSESTPPPPESAPPESPPPAPPAAASLDDVTATATFGKPSYTTGETMTITATVSNNGNEPLRLVMYFPHGISPDGIVVTASGLPDNQWLDLPAGQTLTNELTGVAVNPAVDTGTLHVGLTTGDEQRFFAFTVPVTPTTTHVSGTVYDDRNGNGRYDSGEGVPDVTLTFAHKHNYFYQPKTTTNAEGEYAIDVSPGDYAVRGHTPGYLIRARDVTATGSTMDGVDLWAAPVLAKLAVDLEFTRDTYRPDESPTLRVALTNNGDRALTAITAHCTTGEPNVAEDDRWGDLAGDGVDIPPHQARTFLVTEPMPARALDYGYVTAACRFGYAGLADDQSNPSDTDYATVPGRFVDISGHFTATPGADLSGFRLTLTGPDGTCPIVATTTTGPDGKFTLTHVPAGRYLLFAVPPPGWDYKGSWLPLSPTSFVAGAAYDWSFLAFPSPNTSARRPPDCPANGGGGASTPDAQGSPTPALAYTGANVVVPGVAALLALLTGTAAVAFTRRRTRA